MANFKGDSGQLVATATCEIMQLTHWVMMVDTEPFAMYAEAAGDRSVGEVVDEKWIDVITKYFFGHRYDEVDLFMPLLVDCIWSLLLCVHY